MSHQVADPHSSEVPPEPVRPQDPALSRGRQDTAAAVAPAAAEGATAAEPELDEQALQALQALCVQVHASIEDLQQVLERAQAVRAQREQGHSYRQIASTATRPLTVELISATMQRLATAGGRWRREEALALHREGLPMDKIAQLFGVSRQRVSALLKASTQSRES